MAGALFEPHVGLRQQRGRPRGEQPHALRQVAGKPVIVQKPGVEGRHAHHRRGTRQVVDYHVQIELRQEDHRPARHEHHVCRDEKPVRVEDGQRVQQHVIRGKAPAVDQRLCVRKKVRLRQHRPLRPPRRAGCVEEGGKVILLPPGGVKAVGLVGGGFGEAARAIGGQGHQLRVQPLDHRAQIVGLGRIAHHQLRARVLDEIGQLVAGIGRVQRQEDDAGLHAGRVQGQRLGGFLHLCRQTVARHQPRIAQHMGKARRHAQERRVGQALTRGKVQKGRVLAGMDTEQAVVKRVHFAGSFSTVSAAEARPRTSDEVAISPVAANFSWFCETRARSYR